MNINDDDRRIEALLRENLQAVPFLKFIEIQPLAPVQPSFGDFRVKLGLAEGAISLMVDVLGNGEPRYIRQSISRIQEWQKMVDAAYGLIVAPALFEKSATLCREAGISYLDFSGNCWLSFQNIYIERTGKQKLRPEKKLLKSLYYPKAERILRVLLAHPGRAWKTEALAKEADVSIGMVFKVKQHLLKMEWSSDGRDGLQLIAWRELLEDWRQNYSYEKNRIYHFYSLSNATEKDLAMVCNDMNLPYALTLFSGAARLAPYTRIKQLFVYVENAVAAIISRLDLKTVDSGANVTLMVPYDQGLFYGVKEVEGMMIASSVQLYLDLHSYKGRGEEAAQFLLEHVLVPQWSAE